MACLINGSFVDFETIFTKTDAIKEVDLSDKIKAHDFEIPFSVRTNKEANIFLCDNSPHNCYWVQLGGQEEPETANAECHKEGLPNTNGSINGICGTKPNKTAVSFISVT